MEELISITGRTDIWQLVIHKIRNIFSEEFRCRALIIVTIFFLMSFTEVPIGIKINPCVGNVYAGDV